MRTTVSNEMFRWTVRLDGFYIAEFIFEVTARRIAAKIEEALAKTTVGKSSRQMAHSLQTMLLAC